VPGGIARRQVTTVEPRATAGCDCSNAHNPRSHAGCTTQLNQSAAAAVGEPAVTGAAQVLRDPVRRRRAEHERVRKQLHPRSGCVRVLGPDEWGFGDWHG